MKRKKLFTAICLTAGLLLAGCTKDDVTDDNTLPEGKYPLEIASVTMSVESSERPWSANAPQTRVTESDTDGKSSVWEWNGTEKIGVQIGDGKTGTYVLNESKTITAENACYWASTATGQTVKAWFPTTDKPISLADQSKGLAYVLQATKTVDFDKTVTLGFTHQLAKVRVLLDGTQAAQAKNVEVMGCTSCTHTQGAVTAGDTKDWLKMKHTIYDNGTECWEANVVPGTIALYHFIRLNGTNVVTNLSDIPQTLVSGKMYTVDLTVGKSIIDITSENCNNINGTENYRVKGSFGQTITVTGGNPTIYLDGADISASTPIRITGNSTATIHVTGGNNAVTSTSGTGILVEKGSTLIITSENTDNVITVRGKYNSSNDYPGIGGNESGDCGTIRIENVTVHAYGDGTFACAPGIGPSQNYSCEGIIIEEAVVYAFGTGSDNLAAPGIGSSMHDILAEIGAIPKIEITHSTIHAVRGGVVADYIGRAGRSSDSASSEVNPGTGGSIKSSTVYCYTRDTYRLDKTMVYDASGNAMEQ